MVQDGITPAPAGNTSTLLHLLTTCKDHPRACGKHGLTKHQTTPYPGSPPRLRETHTKTCRTMLITGITPAPAGNTLVGNLVVKKPRDHPRACGKHISLAV